MVLRVVGKSRFCGEKLNALLLRYPNSTGLVLRKTREAMTNSTVLQMRSIIGLPHVKNVVHKPNMHRFEYSNGSILAYGGMKDDAQKEAIRSIVPVFSARRMLMEYNDRMYKPAVRSIERR